MANMIYNGYKKSISKFDWEDNGTYTVRMMLVDNTYNPDKDNHVNRSDISGEVTGTGYIAGGLPINSRTTTVDNVNDWAEYDGEDVNWTSSTITAAYGIVYLDTGDDSTSSLITLVDFNGNKSSFNGDFIVQFHADGVFKLV